MVSFDIQNVIDDHFMEQMREKIEEIGKIRFVKYIHEMIWIAFVDNSHALAAVELGMIKVKELINKQRKNIEKVLQPPSMSETWLSIIPKLISSTYGSRSLDSWVQRVI